MEKRENDFFVKNFLSLYEEIKNFYNNVEKINKEDQYRDRNYFGKILKKLLEEKRNELAETDLLLLQEIFDDKVHSFVENNAIENDFSEIDMNFLKNVFHIFSKIKYILKQNELIKKMGRKIENCLILPDDVIFLN